MDEDPYIDRLEADLAPSVNACLEARPADRVLFVGEHLLLRSFQQATESERRNLKAEVRPQAVLS